MESLLFFDGKPSGEDGNSIEDLFLAAGEREVEQIGFRSFAWRSAMRTASSKNVATVQKQQHNVCC